MPGRANPAVTRTLEAEAPSDGRRTSSHASGSITRTVTAAATALTATVEPAEAATPAPSSANAPVRRPGLAIAAAGPVAERGQRRRQGEEQERHHGGADRPAPATQVGQRRWPVGGRREASGAPPGEPPFDDDHDQRHDAQQQAVRHRDGPVEESVGVDRAGQRLEAQQFDGPEVRQRVQADQQAAGGDGRPHGGERDRGEDRPAAAPEHAGGLLVAGVEMAQPGAHRQVHVGVGEERERTSQAAQKPSSRGRVSTPRGERICSASPPRARRAMNAVAPTNVGKTRGSGASAAQSRRPGSSSRTVAHARPVPTTMAAADTVTASSRELRRGAPGPGHDQDVENIGAQPDVLVDEVAERRGEERAESESPDPAQPPGIHRRGVGLRSGPVMLRRGSQGAGLLRSRRCLPFRRSPAMADAG